MKRIIIFTATLLLAVMLSAKPTDIVSEARKSNMQFEKIDVSRCVSVIVEQRKEGNIILRAEARVMPYVELEVTNNTLHASISSSFKISKTAPKVEILIPDNGKIKNIECRESAKIIFQPVLTSDLIQIECSGASTVELNCESKTIEIECRGASILSGKITTEKCTMACSGASCIKGTLNCTELMCECGGASKLKLEGTAQNAELSCAGASKADFEKIQCKTIKAKVSGASASSITGENCTVVCSGASNMRIDCSTLLNIDVSGGASVTYRGDCLIGKLNNNFGSIKHKQAIRKQ